MQISVQEAAKALQRARGRRPGATSGTVRTIEDLARKHNVNLADARRHAERAQMMEEDPARARRVRELAARVKAGEYQVDGEQVVDMALRRCQADRAADLD
ncbi:MAG: flagellar biosynthesis anti-sigma factor FlgM [Armatimonadetes bacterium]|nr:flagellar biosynthesis anti-sigma factor FlgM [Armatimonadota bacterium]